VTALVGAQFVDLPYELLTSGRSRAGKNGWLARGENCSPRPRGWLSVRADVRLPLSLSAGR
jgi:hypothetical protein